MQQGCRFFEQNHLGIYRSAPLFLTDLTLPHLDHGNDSYAVLYYTYVFLFSRFVSRSQRPRLRLQLPYPTGFCAGFGQELIPIVRRMTTLQHLAKDLVGVIATLAGPLALFVIHPGVDDYLALGVVAE